MRAQAEQMERNVEEYFSPRSRAALNKEVKKANDKSPAKDPPQSVHYGQSSSSTDAAVPPPVQQHVQTFSSMVANIDMDG